MNIIREIGGLEVSMKEKNNKTQPVVEQKTEKKHLEANQLSGGAKKSMLTRIISAVVGLAILVPSLILGDWIYFAVISVALCFATWEILGCCKRRTVVIYIVYLLFIGLIAYWPIFRQLLTNGFAMLDSAAKIDMYYQQIYLPIIVVVIGFFLLFLLTVIFKDFSVLDACFLITMGILIGFGFQCLFYLRYIPLGPDGFNIQQTAAWTFNYDNTVKTSLLLIYVIFSTFMTDTGAYFVGVFFGKNKMNERISPKKTWEGFVGGIVISFILSSAFALILAACKHPIYPGLQFYDDGTGQWYMIFPLSLAIPFFATLGDFVFSSIKRYWGIKDYGKLIPGHGGVLDRLDSIFFAVIVASIFIFMMNCLQDNFDWSKFLV